MTLGGGTISETQGMGTEGVKRTFSSAGDDFRGKILLKRKKV